MNALREHLRAPVSFVATITRKDGQVLTGEVLSASLGGAYIACDHGDLREGESCEVSIILSDGQVSIEGTAVVCYLKPEGIGVRFEGVDASSLEHLTRLMMLHVHTPEAIRSEARRLKGKKQQ